jgi:uncharacterized membrane protein YhiD involved in acid resistance
MSSVLFQSLAISLLLGGLVGLQRQHVEAPLGGVRTFPLITVFGSPVFFEVNIAEAAGFIGLKS